MTDIDPRGGRSWSVDVLADLHAGVLDEATAAELWPKAQADPEAREILAALDATSGSLGELGQSPAPEPIPEHVAARLDRTIAGEQAARGDQPRGNVADLGMARRKRNKRTGWISGVVAAAAVVVALATVGVANLGGGNTEQGNPVAEKPNELQLDRSELGSKGMSAALGARDYGPLRDAKRLSACLAANQAGTVRDVAGAKQLDLEGKPAVMILLTTGKTGQFRMLVVGKDCAEGKPSTLSNSLVGGSGLPVPTG